ncbi:MAG: three-Cys-motif partner protein TcmP [Bryobacteraceae bacterium]|jgi:three-Cys-motif partner protein
MLELSSYVFRLNPKFNEGQKKRKKQQIAVAYFESYMNVMARHGRTAQYADLFAGPGVYDNGDKSVPILICERVVADERLRKNVRLWFNEGDPDLKERLVQNVAKVPGVSTLTHPPSVTAIVITTALAPKLQSRLKATFVFADPCGYKGLSVPLISAALKGFGNDCLFFFNYNRVNMKLGYPVMDESINEFFGTTRAQALREELKTISSPARREQTVLGAIKEALKDAGAVSPLAFAFRTRDGGGTSHHLVFASKESKGVTIMKRLMNQASSRIVDGVGSWDFDPRSTDGNLELFSGLEEIKQRLLAVFAGREITFRDLVAEELDQKCTDSNFRDALLELERDGIILCDPPAELRSFQSGGQKRTMPARTIIRFPTRTNL